MEKSKWKVSSKCDENKRANYEKICSICLSKDYKATNGSAETRSNNPLITPCLCVGKRSHQHKRCIEDWIEQTGTSSCPFCFVRYEYSRKNKGFLSYLRDFEAENELLINLMAFLFAIYLFIVGLSICCYYIQQGGMAIDHGCFSLILFCLVCTGTVLLFIGIVSFSLKTILHHYLRYSLWKTTNFKVNVKAYEVS